MAKWEPSPIISGISGRLGDCVFSRIKGQGRITAAPPTKRNPSQLLQAHQCIVSQANKDWANLTPELKKMWQEMALLEQAVKTFKMTESTNGRLFYLGYRIRCLHADAGIAFDFVPDSPIYYQSAPNIELFGVSFGFRYRGFPSSAPAPYPWSAAWISWSPNGTAAAGKTWRKFWPVPGYTQFASAVNLDPIIFNAIGIPPEWRPQTTGYRDQLVPVKIRHYRVYPYGKIFMSADYDLWAPSNRFYFREPPRALVFSNPTP